MKKILLVILVVITVNSAWSQDKDTRPTISVVGNAQIETMPDEVTFTLDVSKTEKDLQLAKRLNDESVKKILEITKAFAVKPGNVKTDAISVEMRYQFIRDAKVKIVDEDGDETGKRIFLGYEVSKTVTVKLTEMSRFEDFFGEVLKTGLTEVRNVTFGSSKSIETRIEAREMAMKAARAKASAMAGAIGQTIGKAILIQEGVMSNTNPGYSVNGSANNFASNISRSEIQSVTTTFAPGAIKVEATVSIVFLLN